MAGIGSAAIFFLAALPIFISLLLNSLFVDGRISIVGHRKISLWTYAIGQAPSLLTGSMFLLGVTEFFVPLVCYYPIFRPWTQNTTCLVCPFLTP